MKKGSEVNLKEYVDIRTKKTVEMREQFRKRRQQGGGRPGGRS